MPAFHPEEINEPHNVRARSMRDVRLKSRSDRVGAGVLVVVVIGALAARAIGLW